MNTTTETEYLTETKFRNAVKKVLPGVNSKKMTESGSPLAGMGIHIRNAEGHWATESTIFRVQAGYACDMDQVVVERALVLSGFEMVETEDEGSYNHIAWRKAA